MCSWAIDLGQLCFGGRVVHFRLAVGQGFLGALLGFQRLGFVQVMGTDGRIGQHRDHVGLRFKHAAGNIDQLVSFLIGKLEADRPRLDAGQQRRVVRHNPQFAGLTRENGDLDGAENAALRH